MTLRPCSTDCGCHGARSEEPTDEPTNADRAERGLYALNEYAEATYPGAENTEDPDGAFTVAADLVSDLLHYLTSVGHPKPEDIFTMAQVNWYEETDDEKAATEETDR